MLRRVLLGLLAVGALALLPAAAAAHHATLPSEAEAVLDALPGVQSPDPAGSDADVHSPNMALLANFDAPFDEQDPAGADLAFWGETAVAGIYDRPGGFRLLSIADPRNPRLLGEKACPGPQGDVSIFRDLVFMSVDSARESEECGAGAAPTSQFMAGEGFEGVRIFDISDKANPEQIKFVNTDCGSHTHTLVPDLANGRVLIYVLSYPLGVQAKNCSVASHRKISVVSVPLDDPRSAEVVSTPSTGQTIGCHDVTVHMERRLAAAACITESQVWDISDPVNPKTLSTVRHPDFQIHHSSAFSNDGRTMVLGDEMGGAAAAMGCLDAHLPFAALWFFDISGDKKSKPEPKGRYKLPEDEQREATLLCTAHNFNTVPVKSDRDVLTSAFYNGGTTVLDFTDPAEPQQLGFYKPEEDPEKESEKASPWSSYWYNGFIYANNFDVSYVPSDPRSRGFDVMAILDRDLHDDQVKLPYLNPQTQEPLPASEAGTAGQSGAAPVGAADRRDGPRYAYHLDRRRLGSALRRGIRARVRCSASCRPAAALTVSARDARRYGLRRTVVARGGRTRAVTGRKTFRLRFSREARRKLRGARRLSLRLVAVTHTGGERKVTRKRYALRR